MTDSDLIRFVDAQARVREEVTSQLVAGRKTTHWMWFVFPQIEGLARSPTARHFAISGLEQARRYLDDPLLGERLRADVNLMLTHAERSAHQILGSPDDLKFRSCLTLFGAAARSPADQHLFRKALDQFYDGASDELTLSLLQKGSR